jgi:hypothetical protein
MAYLGNLTCSDCGLTFTARWGSFEGADEYRCGNDHVVHVHPETGSILALDGDYIDAPSLVELRGHCPVCDEELRTGVLPCCPVCGSRNHEVAIAGSLG